MKLSVFDQWRPVSVVGVSFVDGYPETLLVLSNDIRDWENGVNGRPPVELRRNPLNPYDSNAVEVRRSNNDTMLGHLPKDLAARVAPSLDRGEMWEAEIDYDSVQIHPDHPDRPGLTINIRRIA